MVIADIIGGSAEDLHQDIFISPCPLHGLPQLLHSVDNRRVQHGEDGLLKVPWQLFLQNVHQLLPKTGHGLSVCKKKLLLKKEKKSALHATYIIILIKVGLFNILPLTWAAVRQDVNDGLLVSSWGNGTD